MYSNKKFLKNTNSYNNIDIDTIVLNSKPNDLITILFDKAIEHINKALYAISINNQALRHTHIDKAIKIIDIGLNGHLATNIKEQPTNKQIIDVCHNLQSCYEVTIQHLLLGNLNNDTNELIIAKNTLEPLLTAWKTILNH